MARGKPHPDIFLHAAAEMNVPPAHCLVIEDSASGVQGARAAGMTVIGMLAASHIQGNHADRLLDAGADHVTETFAAAAVITREFLAS
ncbi:MAG: HAD family phosphatase [Rhodospirillaceae bacterium]|nr:HAD family phosphatase [Rhodospirillaceae bacterium]MBT3910217.1 HAD family phosphatase [Rhodospirillaceae bacterium]MBT5298584.1 HAD family phosphatase [Rhodospirillaceae bacterium]MBT5512984.1 HAD family phosphatase [Rhodospirillaceae bacterium]MBT6084257.1 HAD family phosphatase [Rhodospirillaceae bacterium]